MCLVWISKVIQGKTKPKEKPGTEPGKEKKEERKKQVWISEAFKKVERKRESERAIIDGIKAVSYTHLDVYKRQAKITNAFAVIFIIFFMP